MKFSDKYASQIGALLADAKKELAANMEQRGIGLIVWNLFTAGFHYLPEVSIRSAKGSDVVRISGIYRKGDELYLLEEGKAPVSTADLYNPDSEVEPTVATLPESEADEKIGNPATAKGLTQEANLSEWLVVADCYFEALAE